MDFFGEIRTFKMVYVFGILLALNLLLEKKGFACECTHLRRCKNRLSSKSPKLIPFRKIVKYRRISSPYGCREHPYEEYMQLHKGVDLAAKIGAPIHAPIAGVVSRVAYNEGGYGHYIILSHENGFSTLYAHLKKKYDILDEYIYRDENFAEVGPDAHLHFELRLHNIQIDPKIFFCDKCKKKSPEALPSILNQNLKEIAEKMEEIAEALGN